MRDKHQLPRAPSRVAAVAVLVSAAGCGYHVVRADAPFGARTIAVIPFQEEVPVGLSAELSRELTRLLATGGVRVTHDRSAADGVLSGVVLSARTTTSPVATSGTRIPAYNIRAVVRARLDDGRQQLWSTQVAADDVFLPSESDATVGTQTLETEANRRLALSRLALALARDLHQQLVIAGSLASGRQ